MWYRQGARPKEPMGHPHRAVSAEPSRRRDSPSNRVHFNDDIDYSDSLQRTVSLTNLTDNGAMRFQFSFAPGEKDNGGTFSDLHGPGRPFEDISSDQIAEDETVPNNAPSDDELQNKHSASMGPELAHEIGYYSKLYEDINSKNKAKKSRKPWKRNKAKFTPSDDDVRVFSNLVKARSTSNIAQSSGCLSGSFSESYENIPPAKNHNDTYENLPSLDDTEENPYEEMPHVRRKVPPVKPPRPLKKQDHGKSKYF